MTGTLTLALIACTVWSRFSWVTPVEPPTMIASVPRSYGDLGDLPGPGRLLLGRVDQGHVQRSLFHLLLKDLLDGHSKPPNKNAIRATSIPYLAHLCPCLGFRK